MSLLVNIAKEYTRVSGLGYIPVIVIMSDATLESLKEEMARILNNTSNKLIGMNLVKSHDIADGEFRILARFDPVPEDTLERWQPSQTSL